MKVIFRIIESIPSKKAEPFKRWMAQVAAERINQMIDPERSIDQAVADYCRLGYSEAWINQRIKTIEIRKQRNPDGLSENAGVAKVVNLPAPKGAGRKRQLVDTQLARPHPGQGKHTRGGEQGL